MFHHLAASFALGARPIEEIIEITRETKEDQLDHLLRLRCRAGMCYTLLKRGVYK